MLYRILRVIVAIGIKLYYREIKVKNAKNFNVDGPCILLANHPNTLMDAWMVGYVTKQPVYFMAKATFFSSPFKQRMLKSLNMIPINRKGEGVVKGVANKDSFEACYQILEEGKTLAIFPEGTSYLERHLRELKSGAARIALETESRNEGKLGVKIIPLGLNYIHADQFRSDVLVNVGTPMEVSSYIEDYQQNAGLTAKRLTEQVRIRLEQLLVNSDLKEEEKLVEELHAVFTSKYIKSDRKGVEGQVKMMKQIRDALEELRLGEPWKIDEIRDSLTKIQWKLNKFEIRSDFLDRRFRSTMFLRQIFVSIVFLLIGLPLFLYGFVHNVIQYKFVDFMIPKLTKEPEYYAPLAVLISLAVYPLVYLAFMFGANALFDLNFLQKFVYFWSMPLMGMFAYQFFYYLNHIAFKWKFVFLIINNKQTLLELQAEKNRLRDVLFES